MKNTKVSLKRILPPPALKKLADRIFLIALVCILLGSYLSNLNEGFISTVAALSVYLGSLGIQHRKPLISRSIYTLFFSLTSIFLGALDTLHLLFIVPIYTFLLVFLERDGYHRGIPAFFLPLSILFFSLEIPLNHTLERSLSVFTGSFIGLAAGAITCPSGDTSRKRNTPPFWKASYLREAYILFKFKGDLMNPLKLMYSLRKSVGLSLIFLTGVIFGREFAAGGGSLFLILHTSIDEVILPKSVKRMKGTILGGLLYLPLGYLIESEILISIVALVALYLGFLFIQHCYSTAVTFITLNFLLFSGSYASFERVILYRLLFVILGGGTALIVSLLIPLRDKEKVS